MICVWVSVRASSSHNALLTLLSVWIFACILTPKATVNIASHLHPAPSSFAFNERIKEDEIAKVLEKEILKKYGVDFISRLPVNFDAIAMQEGEIYSSKVYDKHFTALQQTYHAQNKVSEIVGLVNPFLAILQLSMAFSGSDSDYVTHTEFQQQAEKHRFALVELLNNHMRDHSKTGDWYFNVNYG